MAVLLFVVVVALDSVTLDAVVALREIWIGYSGSGGGATDEKGGADGSSAGLAGGVVTTEGGGFEVAVEWLEEVEEEFSTGRGERGES